MAPILAITGEVKPSHPVDFTELTFNVGGIEPALMSNAGVPAELLLLPPPPRATPKESSHREASFADNFSLVLNFLSSPRPMSM